MSSPPLALVSLKLRLGEGHVRAVPGSGLDGCVFGGPGIDLFGDDAARVVQAAAPLLAGLHALEPGIVLRAVSIDFATPRVLATIVAEPRPRVVRVAGMLPERWLEACPDLVPVALSCIEKALRRRLASSTPEALR